MTWRERLFIEEISFKNVSKGRTGMSTEDGKTAFKKAYRPKQKLSSLLSRGNEAFYANRGKTFCR